MMNKRTEKSIQNPNHKISLVIEALSIGILLSIGLCNFGFAQGIGINIETPHESALVEVYATDKGVLIPRLTTAERNIIPSPATGLIIYNTNTNKFNFWDGANWEEINDIFVSTVTGTGTPSEGGVSINISGDDPDPSAMLDIKSDGADKKGLLMPRTTTSAVNYPAEGLLIYNTGTSSFSFYDGTTWQSFCHEEISTTTGTGSFTSDGTGINTNTPDPSAILEMSSDSHGFLIPRLTETQRENIISPATGLMIYNITEKSIDVYTSDGWHKLMYNLPSLPGTISGTTTLCENATEQIYSISPVIGATSYTWTVPSGATITSGQGTTSITVDFSSSSGNVCVTANNGCGSSPSNCKAITVNIESIAPTGALASSNPICLGESTTLSVTGGSLGTGASWEWYSSSCGGTYVGSGTPTVTPSSTTTYYVRAEGYCDTTSCVSMQLITLSAPSVPVADAASNITESGFTANWQAVSDAQSYYLQVSTTSDFSSLIYNNNVGDVLHQPISSLNCATAYYYRVKAINICDDSGYSSTINLTTSDCPCNPEPCSGVPTVTYNGYTYHTVQISSQCWFVENLRTTKYRNGTSITQAISNADWSASGTSGKYCNPGTDGDGYFYDYYAASSANKICPTGWRSPYQSDFQTLMNNVPNAASVQDDVNWTGTNSCGWTGLPGGYRAGNGTYYDNQHGFWWTTSSAGGSYYVDFRLYENNTYQINNYGSPAKNGEYVRCIKE